MNKKRGFTLAEGLVSILIVSVVGIMAMQAASAYYKNTAERDAQLKQLLQNVNVVERIKTDVHTKRELLELSQNQDVRIIEIGTGEIKLTDQDGEIKSEVLYPETSGFSEKFINRGTLFRIVVGTDDIPNTKLTTIVYIKEE